MMAFQSSRLTATIGSTARPDVRRAVFAFEGLRSWRVESETVVGLQLNHPSGATIMLLS
jgi:hypothetical protein